MIKIQVRSSDRQCFQDITGQVQEIVTQSEVQEGLCHLFCTHTTAGITFNENWDPDVRHDMGVALDAVVPQRREFRHGEGNSPAHVKSSLVGADHTLFISDGKLVLGTWQGIYLAEFDGPRTRQVLLKISPM